MGKGTDGIARVRAREGTRGNGLAAYPAWKTVAAILGVRLVVGKVGVVCVVASKRQLGLLVGGGRVAGKETRRHCAQVKGEETTVGSKSTGHVLSEESLSGEDRVPD